MKLTVPTNWQEDLIKKIKKPGVDSIYGKLDTDFLGGGRPSCVLMKVTKSKVKKHIGEIHKEGLRFYYLLNASCLGNREWVKKGYEEINKLLNWLSEISVDGVIIASPYLLQHIKRKHPSFEISISCFANINSVEKAKFWEGLGASTITLSHVELNRNFRLLEKIRKQVRCELQLLVNDNCILDCPLFFYHNNITSHASQNTKTQNIFMFDYCRIMCRYRMFSEPINFIRSAWIRPEDLPIYENIGIDRFKLVDRTMTTDAIRLIVEAYSAKSYKGNLYDLFMNPSKSLWLTRKSLLHKLRYFFHPFAVNIFMMLKNRNLVNELEVYIDNTNLDGFINHFFDDDCRYKSCKECGYCQEVSDRVVKIEPDYKEMVISSYGKFLNEIISGEIFKY